MQNAPLGDEMLGLPSGDEGLTKNTTDFAVGTLYVARLPLLPSRGRAFMLNS